MFFEDHLIESSDSEHAAPHAGVASSGAGAELEGATPASSRHPFGLRAASQGTVSGAGQPPTSAAAADLQLLVVATENERHCPDILPYPTALIDAMVAHIAERQARIAALAAQERQDAATQALSLLPFKPSDLMALELQRVQFFLCELLRCRLRKIDSLCMSIFYEGQAEAREVLTAGGGVDSEEAAALPQVRTPQRAHLSPNECAVADRLAMAKQQAVVRAALHSAPEPLQYLVPHPPHGEGLEILPEPELSTYVFGVALRDLGVVQVGEFAEQAINAGEIFLMPYRTFRPYVIAGHVRLL